MADTAMSQLGLDEVRFVVAHEPWQKMGDRVVTDSAIRLSMAAALVEGHPGLSADDQEIRRQGLTYTVDTLEAMNAENPADEIFLIVGADTAERIHTWHRLPDVLRLSTLVIVNRSSDIVAVPSAVQGARHEVITMEPVHVSSSDLRAAVATGASIEAMTSPAVQAIITQHHLYEVVS
jgi:nicotinate-nucleotide adenylyltransferase